MRQTLCFTAAALLAVVLASAACRGADADRVFSVTVKDAKSGKDQPVHLWLPEGLEVARGAICQMRYSELVTRRDYRRLARLRQFALLGGMLEHGGDLKGSLTTALKALAKESGHPEVEHLPLALSGFSNGGWMAVNLAKVMPDRVLCVAVCGMPGLSHDTENPSHVKAFRCIPVLQVNGANDGATHGWYPTMHAKARGMRYLWGLAHQWHVKHVYGNTNALAWPFEQEVIAARLPADADPRQGPVPLRPLHEEDGWLGDTETWRTNYATIRPFAEDEVRRTTNTWLASEHVAHVWRAFVTYQPTLRVSLAPDPSRRDTTVVRAEGEFPEDPAKVCFFDGKHLLGEDASPPYEIRTNRLAAGVHSVFAVCLLENEPPRATRPVLWVDGGSVNQDLEEKAAKATE